MTGHGYLQCVGIHRVTESLAAESPHAASLPFVRIEHRVIRHVVLCVASEESREYQVSLIPVDILVGVPVDKAAVHAAIRMQIDHKVNLIGLK